MFLKFTGKNKNPEGEIHPDFLFILPIDKLNFMW